MTMNDPMKIMARAIAEENTCGDMGADDWLVPARDVDVMQRSEDLAASALQALHDAGYAVVPLEHCNIDQARKP